MDTIPFVICFISVASFALMEGAHVDMFWIQTPHTASSVFLSTHMAGPGGIFASIFWLSNYKESTQRGEHAAMQDSARQGILFSFFIRMHLGFVCLADMPCYDLS
jgi:hypothetical protein